MFAYRNAAHLARLDGSGSMCDAVKGATRWSAVRAALVAGIEQTQLGALFGAFVFDGTIGLLHAAVVLDGRRGLNAQAPTRKQSGDRPLLVQISPALDNAGALQAALPATEPSGSSPTHFAMREAVDQLIEQVGADPSLAPDLVLVTDSVPRDSCGTRHGRKRLPRSERALQWARHAADMSSTSTNNYTFRPTWRRGSRFRRRPSSARRRRSSHRAA
jgi:hypothetical protein